jgi:hypothetical protein
MLHSAVAVVSGIARIVFCALLPGVIEPEPCFVLY